MAERVFAMPDLGEGLEEGEIVAWLVAEGDEVALNHPIVEVETAKATVEIPSPFAGRVVTLHGAAGEAVPVGAPLVTFAVEGPPEPEPEPEREDAERAPAGVRPASPATEPRPTGGAATPPVRRLAKELGVNIRTVEGSGPGDRVTEADVRRAAGGAAPDVDPIRREIAVTLSRQAAIPQVTTFRTVDCTELQIFRKELGVSPLPVLLAALCRTIEGHPLLNARWAEDRVETRGMVNVGIAADTERGLVVPVLRDAAGKRIADLASEIKRLAEGARAGKLALEDIAPVATIAVSNTGSYGSEAGTPLLSPGTGVTLAFGVITDRALVVDGRVEARPAATFSLTFDHRVLDGAEAGRALTDLVAILQSAERLRDLPG